MDTAAAMETIRRLCSFEGRGPGTDAERRAANDLAQQLNARGRRAEIEPVFVHPEYALYGAAHCALAVAGSLVAVAVAPVGFALALLAATSFYLEQSARMYLLRSLFYRRSSQHVVSPGGRPEAPVRLYLCAHYDAARTGFVFRPQGYKRLERLSPRTRLLLGPFRLIFWGGMAPLLVTLGARMAGVDALWLSVAQLLPTMVLIVSAVLLIDIRLSNLVPGAYDNASGVATVLAVASELDHAPPQNLDVWLLLVGAEECNTEGMYRFIRAHRKELDKERTLFVNVDSTAYGTVHYQVSEGAIVSRAMDPRMVELCEAIAAADRENGDRYGAVPFRNPAHTDALPPATFGFRAISILGLDRGLVPPWYHNQGDTPDKIDEAAMARAADFTLELVRQIDRDAERATP